MQGHDGHADAAGRSDTSRASPTVAKGTRWAREPVWRAPLRMALVYAVLAALWILLSDQLLASLGLPHALEVALSSIKGFLFVAVTAATLYLTAQRYLATIRASEEHYRGLFENATEGVTLYSVTRDADKRVEDLTIDDVNPAQVAWSGVPRHDLVGRRMSERGDSHQDQELRPYFDLVREAAETGTPLRVEMHDPHDDTYMLVAAFPFGGQDIWAVTRMDITDVRRAQQALRRQDEEIRQTYVQVLDAVTGGKLVLVTDSELLAQLGEPLTNRISIREPEHLCDARRQIRDAAEKRFPEVDAQALINAVGEALNNALKHAGSGAFQVFAADSAVQVLVTDPGPGIDFRTLPRATLVPGFSTTATLGMGFTIMLQLCDRVLLATRKGSTMVVLEMAATREAAGL